MKEVQHECVGFRQKT